MQCSFKTVSSKPCSTIQGSSLITSLSTCQNDIANHLRNCLLQREGLIKNEDDLLRFRGGYFEESSSSLTICPTHKYEFGVTWRKSVYCVLQFACGGNKKPRKARQDCSVNCKQSLYMWKEEQRLIPVGSGVCVACRIELIGRMKLFEEEPIIQHKQLEMTEAINVDRVMDTVDNNDKDSMCEVMELSQSTASTFSDASEWPLDMASSQSTCSTVQLNSPMRKRMALNSFLEEVGISPVKKVLSVDWMSASNRTKSDYERKAKQIMEQVLSILTPGQENQLEIFLSDQDTNKNNDLLKSVSAAYTTMTSWGVQRQLLSLLVKDYSFVEIQKGIPNLSRYKYTSAKKHAELNGVGMPVTESKLYREKATKQQIDHFLQFVLSPAIMTDSPFGECNVKLASGSELTAPKIILNTVRTRTVNLYLKYCEEMNYFSVLSDRSYMRLLEAIQPSVRKSMKGLDNYAAEGGKAFDDMKTASSILGQIGKGKQWEENVHQLLNDGKQYLKVQYKLHISQSIEVSDHCCPFALSHDDQKYSRKCEHTHGRSCTECEQISSVLGLISNAATIAEFESEDQKDEVQYLVNQSKKSIHEWKQHILRTVNQDRARKVVMDNLEKDEALLERDWAMKFLPMQYRESQSKWFPKRGLSWHVGVVSMKTDQNDYQNFTIVHVFDNATQDALTSTSILQDTINHINKENKKIKTLYLRSDNAGCFHSSYSLTTIPMINKKSLIKIKRVDFSGRKMYM